MRVASSSVLTGHVTACARHRGARSFAIALFPWGVSGTLKNHCGRDPRCSRLLASASSSRHLTTTRLTSAFAPRWLTHPAVLHGRPAAAAPQPFHPLSQRSHHCFELLVLEAISAVKVCGQQEVVLCPKRFLSDVTFPADTLLQPEIQFPSAACHPLPQVG